MTSVQCPSCGTRWDPGNPKVPGYCEDCETVYDLSVQPPASPTPCCQGKMHWGSPKKRAAAAAQR